MTRVLQKLDKGHTRADFIAVVREFQSAGLTLAPTFIPFTPWTTRESYRELLQLLMELDLVEHVAPVQLALRLLIPRGSRLLELDDVQAVLRAFDEPALLYRWQHPDPQVDALAAQALRIAASHGSQSGRSRREIFGYLWNLVNDRPLPADFDPSPPPPFLTWTNPGSVAPSQPKSKSLTYSYGALLPATTSCTPSGTS